MRRRPNSASNPGTTGDSNASTSTPALRHASSLDAPSPVVATSTRASWIVRRSWHGAGKSPLAVTTIRTAMRAPAGRAVSSGSSATNVPRPTKIASTRPRSS